MGQAGQAGAVDVHHLQVISNRQPDISMPTMRIRRIHDSVKHERYLLAVRREQDAPTTVDVFLDAAPWQLWKRPFHSALVQ